MTAYEAEKVGEAKDIIQTCLDNIELTTDSNIELASMLKRALHLLKCSENDIYTDLMNWHKRII